MRCMRRAPRKAYGWVWLIGGRMPKPWSLGGVLQEVGPRGAQPPADCRLKQIEILHRQMKIVRIEEVHSPVPAIAHHHGMSAAGTLHDDTVATVGVERHLTEKRRGGRVRTFGASGLTVQENGASAFFKSSIRSPFVASLYTFCAMVACQGGLSHTCPEDGKSLP